MSLPESVLPCSTLQHDRRVCSAMLYSSTRSPSLFCHVLLFNTIAESVLPCSTFQHDALCMPPLLFSTLQHAVLCICPLLSVSLCNMLCAVFTASLLSSTLVLRPCFERTSHLRVLQWYIAVLSNALCGTRRRFFTLKIALLWSTRLGMLYAWIRVFFFTSALLYTLTRVRKHVMKPGTGVLRCSHH